MQLFPQTSYELTCISARRNLWIQVQLPSLRELDLASNNISQAHLRALHPSALQDLRTQRTPLSESHGPGPHPAACGEALHLAGAPRLASLASSPKEEGGALGPHECLVC